jgi:hypothetical protein
VRATCEEFGIRYHVAPTWRQAFANHWRELRLLGRTPERMPATEAETAVR